MTKIKELNSKCKFSERTIVDSCGPNFVASIVAEKSIEDNGEKLYLTAYWLSDFDEELVCFANKESLFDYLTLEKIFDEEYYSTYSKNLETIENSEDIKNSQYYEQYKILTELVKEEMKKQEIIS